MFDARLYADWFAHLATLFQSLTAPDFSALLLLRFLLQSVAGTLVIVAADYLLGIGLLRLIAPRLGMFARASLALALGSGIAGTAFLLVGYSYRLDFWIVFAELLLSALLGAALLTFKRGWRWALWPLRAVNYRVLLLLSPLILIYLLDLMMPVIDYDSTLYHMGAARWYKESGWLAYHPGIRLNAQPHLHVLLYLRQWIVLGEDNLVKLANIEFALVLAFALAAIGRILRVKRGASLAIGFVCLSPAFLWVARLDYADFALPAWMAAATVAALLCLRREDWTLAAVAGACLGFAGATKLHGLVAAAFVLTGWALASFQRHRDLRRALWPPVVAGLLVMAVGAGWWARSYQETGTPLYPFLGGDPEDARQLRLASVDYGFGRGPLALLLMPIRMLTAGAHKFTDAFVNGPGTLLLIALGAFAFFRRRGERWTQAEKATLTLLSVTFIGFFLFWFYTGQVMRYLAPVVPAQAALMLLLVRRCHWPERPLRLAIAGIAIFAFLFTTSMVRVMQPPPVMEYQKERILGGLLPYYSAIRALRRSAQPTDWTYILFSDDSRYYVPGLSYGDWFGYRRYSWAGEKTASWEQMIERLKANQFKFLLLDRERGKSGGRIYRNNFLTSPLLKPYTDVPGTERLYDDGRLVVYRIL